MESKNKKKQEKQKVIKVATAQKIGNKMQKGDYVNLDLYTLDHKEKEQVFDFKSEIADPSKWKIDIIFIVDIGVKMKKFISTVEQIINEILIDAENHYLYNIQDIIPDADITSFLNVGLIKYDSIDEKIFSSPALIQYFDAKKQLFEEFRNENVSKKEKSILSKVVECLVYNDNWKFSNDSSKFIFHFMKPRKDPLELGSDTLEELRSKGFKYNVMSFSKDPYCQYVQLLANFADVEICKFK
jgi:hypothetical protein